MSGKQFDISIDHGMLKGAKAAFDTCLRAAVAKAIGTGADEESATLKISFEILTSMDKDTGEMFRMPALKYRAGFSVPMKESMEATITEESRLAQQDGEWKMISGQISMDELMADSSTAEEK